MNGLTEIKEKLGAAIHAGMRKLSGVPLLPSQPHHLVSGLWGEEHAVRFLRERGYRILGQRVRVGRKDELDIIARDREQVVFVEVKTRKSEGYGRPVSAVNRQKRYRISRAAVRYLKSAKAHNPLFRFDVVEVIGEAGAVHPRLTHIENAFPLDSRFLYP